MALNCAVVAAEVVGPEAALAFVEGLPLDTSHLFHPIRGDLLRRLGRTDEAALARTGNMAERGFLQEPLRTLRQP